MLLVRYEDLRRDPVLGLHGMLEWLGAAAGAEAVREAVERARIDRLREQEKRDRARILAQAHTPHPEIPLIGSGTVGGWKLRLTSRQRGRLRELEPAMALVGYPAGPLPEA